MASASSSSSSEPIKLTDEQWRAKLTPAQFRVLRQSGTEAPGTGEYNKCKEKGVYRCAGCDNPLYTSETKFDSHCGWPAFFAAIPGALTIHEDVTLGMHRIEMRCAKCGGHLGHVFRGEGYSTPTDERHCVNSVCLKLDKSDLPSKYTYTATTDGKAKK